MSKDAINKELIEHLAELTRINLGEEEEDMVEDLKGIVGHFKELGEVETDDVEPMTGGTDLENKMREDEYSKEKDLSDGSEVKSFPEESGGYLRVPPVF